MVVALKGAWLAGSEQSGDVFSQVRFMNLGLSISLLPYHPRRRALLRLDQTQGFARRRYSEMSDVGRGETAANDAVPWCPRPARLNR